MNFKKWSLALFAVALVAPLSANALGISIVNVTTSTGAAVVGNGDTITFDLLLENSTLEDVNGLDVGVFGYDRGALGQESDNYLTFVGAQSGAGVFGQAYAPGQNLGGLAAAAPQVELGNPIVSQERFVRLFGGVAINPVNGDGTNDSGINDLQTNGSDVHLQVTFAAQGLTATSGSPAQVLLTFGTGEQGYAAVGPNGELSFNNATSLVTVIPEPGTALLMGLGLAGLAGIRRR